MASRGPTAAWWGPDATTDANTTVIVLDDRIVPRTMLFVVTAEHAPDHCWARPENEEKVDTWVDGMADRAADSGVEVHGSYVAPNEHTFYFVLEADDFQAVTTFLGPPLLLDHDARVSPVVSFGEAEAALGL